MVCTVLGSYLVSSLVETYWVLNYVACCWVVGKKFDGIIYDQLMMRGRCMPVLYIYMEISLLASECFRYIYRGKCLIRFDDSKLVECKV